MELPNRERKLIVTFVNVCRVLLALVLMASGLLKAADPIGSAYKLQEYATAFSIEDISGTWLLLLALLQATAEFVVGLFLLVGIYRRVVSLLALVMMLFFTPLSLYIWQGAVIDDCGCFGYAVSMPNSITFIKNIVLLFFAVLVCLGRNKLVCFVSDKRRWMVVLFALTFIAALQGVSYVHLPVVDKGPFAVGSNLREKTTAIPDSYELSSVFVKDSVEAFFAEDSIPPAEWQFVEQRSVLAKRGRKAEIPNFSFVDWEYDVEYANEILADTGYVCLVAIETIEDASAVRADKINDLYDHCLSQGVPLYAATSSSENEILLWRKRTGAEYPILWAEGDLLKAMIRSNPGLLLLKDGRVEGKWNTADIPDIELLQIALTGMPDSIWTSLNTMLKPPFWLVLLFGGLFIIIILDTLLLMIEHRRIGKKSAKLAQAEAQQLRRDAVVKGAAKSAPETADNYRQNASDHKREL